MKLYNNGKQLIKSSLISRNKFLLINSDQSNNHHYRIAITERERGVPGTVGGLIRICAWHTLPFCSALIVYLPLTLMPLDIILLHMSLFLLRHPCTCRMNDPCKVTNRDYLCLTTSHLTHVIRLHAECFWTT